MKMYYAEDRSAGKTGAAASPFAGNVTELFYLAYWSPEQLDAITSLKVGEEMTTRDKL